MCSLATEGNELRFAVATSPGTLTICQVEQSKIKKLSQIHDRFEEYSKLICTFQFGLTGSQLLQYSQFGSHFLALWPTKILSAVDLNSKLISSNTQHIFKLDF